MDLNLHDMYIYRSVQAEWLNINFIYQYSVLTGFLLNPRDAVESECDIPYQYVYRNLVT